MMLSERLPMPRVAPFTGARIEMPDYIRKLIRMGVSLPSRERGLKWCMRPWYTARRTSLPSRERGLKLHMFDDLHAGRHVAPFAGAWIEICRY